MDGYNVLAAAKGGGNIGIIPNPPIFAFVIRLAGGGADLSFGIVAESGEFVFGSDDEVAGTGEVFDG